MSQVNQDLETLADDFVTLLAAYARDQSHTAGVVFMPRMIKPLWIRNPLATLSKIHGNLPVEGLRFPVVQTPRVWRFGARD